jgi:osmoprotectant transport system permease protein
VIAALGPAAVLTAVGTPLDTPGPVIPTFGHSNCSNSAMFCTGWFTSNWGSLLQPALVQHIYMTAIAVVIGFAISMAAAMYAHRRGWFETGFLTFATFLYTIPSLALFLLFVPITGLGLTTIEIGLVGYTFLLLFRNMVTGLRATPPEAIAAAQGMGMSPRQILLRVNLPLAIPSMMAGVRVTTVTVIALAAIAADVTSLGLGKPIFDGIQNGFTTELIASSLLLIVLALVIDTLLVLLQRAITPWVRVAR